MSWIPSLVTGLLSYSGGQSTNASNAQQAQLNRDFQAQQAKEQMLFQERMSSTAHQREVADLKAAGLNPILSAKLGGSSSPPGASGSGSLAVMKDAVTPALTSALNAKMQLAQIEKIEAETDGIRSINKTKSLTGDLSSSAHDMFTATKEHVLPSIGTAIGSIAYDLSEYIKRSIDNDIKIIKNVLPSKKVFQSSKKSSKRKRRKSNVKLHKYEYGLPIRKKSLKRKRRK